MEPSKRPTDEPTTGSQPKRPRQNDGASTSSLAGLITFVCHLCHVVFTEVENLRQHMRIKHGDKSLTCDICSKSFARKDSMKRHTKTCSPRLPPPDLTCHDCQKTFTRMSNLTQHLATHVLRTCDECGKTFQTKVSLMAHRKTHKTIPLARVGDPPPSTDPRNPPSATCLPKGCKTALKGSYERHRVRGSEADVDLPAFLRVQPHANLIRDAIRRKKGVKICISANIVMTRPRNWITRGDPESRPYFTSPCQRVLEATNIEEILDAAYSKINEGMAKYLREGSGWVVKSINFVDLVVSTYRPMKGSSYIPLPNRIRHTHSCVNVKNEDQKRFLWAILSARHEPAAHSDRVSKYEPYADTLNVDGLTFPMSPDQIHKFEKLNNLRINLFGYRGDEVFPIYVSERESKPINLLLCSEEEKQHYVWIKDFNRLMHSNTKHHGQVYYCYYCLHRFS